MKDTPSKHRNGFRKVLRIALALPFIAVLLYLLAAVVGSLVPRNSDWQEAPDGVLIFIRDNGVHVDLVLPASAADVDLYDWVPPSHLVDPRQARGWVAFGWGQREFYLETPRWRDITARSAARAVFGGDALMHVQHIGRPRPSSSMRPLRLSRLAYHRLVATVTAGFVTCHGRTIPLHGRSYGDDDAFYEAEGRYDAFQTSNQWTADALAQAGVRIGVWTPFAQGVTWRFR